MDYLPVSPEEHIYQSLRILSRRRTSILVTVLTITVLAITAIFSLPPRYTATASLILEPAQTRVLDIVNSTPIDATLDRELTKTETEILRSHGLASKIIEKLKLDEDPEFNVALRPATWWGALRAAITGDPQIQNEKKRAMVVEKFLLNLDVTSERGSRVINVSFVSHSARKAALIAGAVVDQYLNDQLEAKFALSERAENWLRDRLSDLAAKLSSSQEAVKELEEKAGLVGFDEKVIGVQLYELETTLALAQSKRSEIETRLAQVEAGVRSPGELTESNPNISSPLIESLRARAAQARKLASELTSSNGQNDPRVVNLSNELRDINGQIETEANRIVEILRGQVAVVRAQEKSMAARVNQIQKRIDTGSENQAQLRALQSEVDANGAIYKTFLSRFKEITGQGQIQQADARVISPAAIPSEPTFPKTRLMIALAILGAIIVAIGVAFVVEFFDQSIRTAGQMEQFAGATALALIPVIKSARTNKAVAVGDLVGEPGTRFAGSIRSLLVGLQLSKVDNLPKVIAVTSSVRGEGATTISRALAAMIVQSGRNAVVVDTSLHKVDPHNDPASLREPGLAELLAREASLDSSTRRDEATGVDMIPRGDISTKSAILVDWERMKDIIAELKTKYDVVVIDTPAVLAEPNARMISQLAEKTILVVRWGKTRRDLVRGALKQLLEAGSDIAGVALSFVRGRN